MDNPWSVNSLPTWNSNKTPTIQADRRHIVVGRMGVVAERQCILNAHFWRSCDWINAWNLGTVLLQWDDPTKNTVVSLLRTSALLKGYIWTASSGPTSLLFRVRIVFSFLLDCFSFAFCSARCREFIRTQGRVNKRGPREWMQSRDRITPFDIKEWRMTPNGWSFSPFHHSFFNFV